VSEDQQRRPEHVVRRDHKDGPQHIRVSDKKWTPEAEAVFLDHLGASCNVTWSAAQAGFTEMTAYYHRRRDPGFARAWQEALATGKARIEMELVRTAIDYLTGRETASARPIKDMTVKDALNIVAAHRRTVEAGAPARWTRPRTLDEMRESILRKLEAIETARHSSAPGGAEGGPPET
jgi:hypothetical protein